MASAGLKVAATLIGAALVTGCAGIRDHRGAVIDPELQDAVQVGVDNKTSVEKTLGRPTFTGQFDPNDWYYVSRTTGTFAFRSPRVTEQTVMHIRFDQAGNVASIRKTGKELIAEIDPVSAKTPTLGRQRSFFDELFGNIGTISQPGLPGSQR